MAYSDEQKKEIIDTICDRIAKHGESLRCVLDNSDLPDITTFYRWIDNDDDKRKQYARACEARADLLFEEIIDIADENNADVYVDDTGKVKIDGNVVQRSRLRVDARKWALSKMNPKKYGEKLELDVKETPMTPEERAARIAALQKKMNGSN